MTKFTNTAIGARGIVLKDKTTVWVEPGESVDLDDADKVHPDFEKGEKAAAKKGEKAEEKAEGGAA